MTSIIIPKRYYEKYRTEPLYNDKERLRILEQNIRTGKVTVVDDDLFAQIEGGAAPDY